MLKTKICETCKKIFKRDPRVNLNQWLHQKFCSRKCYTKIGNNNPKWRGGKIIVDGYFYIFSPNHPFKTKEGYVCEHRLVMEKKLGRYLTKKETIHHLNHNILDNKIENLHLCSSPGKHFIKYHLSKRTNLGCFMETNKSIPLEA